MLSVVEHIFVLFLISNVFKSHLRTLSPFKTSSWINFVKTSRIKIALWLLSKSSTCFILSWPQICSFFLIILGFYAKCFANFRIHKTVLVVLAWPWYENLFFTRKNAYITTFSSSWSKSYFLVFFNTTLYGFSFLIIMTHSWYKFAYFCKVISLTFSQWICSSIQIESRFKFIEFINRRFFEIINKSVRFGKTVNSFWFGIVNRMIMEFLGLLNCLLISIFIKFFNLHFKFKFIIIN